MKLYVLVSRQNSESIIGYILVRNIGNYTFNDVTLFDLCAMRLLFKKYILPILCLALLLWMVWQAGPMQLWHNLVAWNWILVACIGVWLLGYLLNMASLGCIVGCYEPLGSGGPLSKNNSIWQRMSYLMRLTVGGYALNYITPFGLLGGEPWRISVLRKHWPPASANSIVAYYAMMHVLSHILFWMIGLALWCVWQGHTVVSQYSIWSVLGIVIALLVLLLAALYVARRKGWILGLRQLLSEHPRQFATSLLLELLSRMVNVAEYWLLLNVALPEGELSSYMDAYWVVAFSSLFANLLFFSPLQMGTREGGILLALKGLVPTCATGLLPLAVSISFATRIRELFWIVVGLIWINIKCKLHNESNHS